MGGSRSSSRDSVRSGVGQQVCPTGSGPRHSIAGTLQVARESGVTAKGLAAHHGVSRRTAQRWLSPDVARGPVYQFVEYLATAQRPFRLVAHTYSTVLEHKVRAYTRLQLIARIRDLHIESSTQDGETGANRARRGMDLAQRAASEERSAALRLELAACWRVAAEREITESEVFGG